MDPLFSSNLARAISPTSIAIVGASSRPGSFGRRTMDNLRHFTGRVHLVSATTKEIDGRSCHPNVGALPEVPDCVVIAVPRDAVEQVVCECATVGVGGVVVFASGFAETDSADHAKLQAGIAAIAARARMALFGPNCLGVVSYGTGAVMSFVDWPQAQPAVPHRLGLVSQSGSLGLSLAQAARRGVSFSHVLTFGNAAGVDATDLLLHLAGSADCAAIVCVIESSRDPLRLAEAIRHATAVGKPVVLQKIASTEQGRSAALSHTGSLTGAHESYRALLEGAGAVWVEDFEALVEMSAFLAKFAGRPPSATGIAVIGGSGGGGILAADKASRHGVALPQPSAETVAVLRQHVPDFGAARNPCDVTAQVVSNPQSLAACCQALANDAAYGALVSTQTVASAEFLKRLPIFQDVAHASRKPICTVWLSEWHEGPGSVEFEQCAEVALFHSTDRCFAALRAWQDRAERLAAAGDTLPVVPATAARQVDACLRAAEHDVLSERGSKTLLAAYGIDVAKDVFAADLPAAQQAARELGGAVALKVEAAGLAHKSDAGGVRLGLRNSGEIAAAWDDMRRQLAERAPQARFDGFTVSPMVTGDLEMIVGGRTDAQFGPLITVGFGGVLVEVLRDTATEVAPVNRRQALCMLRSLRGAALFDGVRGRPAIDLEALAEIVSRASLLLASHRDTLAELDINPVICSPHGATAVDALAVRAAPQPPSTDFHHYETNAHGEQVVHAD